MKSVLFVGPLYPISGNTTQPALDGSSPRIVLHQPFVYFGQPYNQIYVCKNCLHVKLKKTLTHLPGDKSFCLFFLGEP